MSLGDRTRIMGIMNVTPDSFSDGGRLMDASAAVERALQIAAEGADIIDIGGESTRPGAAAVPEGEERRRILPVIERLASSLTIPISVDTYKAGVADAALGAGAVLVNDISGLRYEPALAEVVARHEAGLVLMHTRGGSKDMYRHAAYLDVIGEVLDELRESVAFAVGAGVQRDRLIIDPGIGFAKEAAQSWDSLARAHAFADLGLPMLIGPSRKSFLTRSWAQQIPAVERDWATAAAVTTAVLCGAHIVRVHAVKEMVQVARVADEIRQHALEP